MTNKIFQDPTATVPRDDPQFVRVPFSGTVIGGRADQIPKSTSGGDMNVSHVASKGGSK